MPSTSLSRLVFLVLALSLGRAAAAGAELPSAEETWIRVQTAHFTLYGDASEGRIRDVGLDLERLRAVLLRLGGNLSAHTPVPTVIYVFRSDAALTPYKPVVDGKPRNLSAYFLPSADGNVIALTAAWNSNPSPIVYHEYLHFFMRNNFPPQPRWYEEGLAEYYSTFRANEREARIGLPVDEHVARLRQGSLMPLRTLLGVDEDSPEYVERSRQGLFYAQSWALVHFLLRSESGRKEQLAQFLARLRGGLPADEAFRASFGMDERELLAELSSYVRRSRFPYMVIRLPDLDVPTETRVAAMDREETLLRLGELLARISGETLGRAESHFRAVLAAAPSHPEALAGMGYVRMRQREDGEAAEFFRLSLESGSADFRVPFHYGTLRLKSLPIAGGSLGPDERGVLADARGAFRKSSELNPEFAEARAALGRTYLWEEGSGAADGIPHLEAALRQLASRTDLAMELSSLYEAAGEEWKSEDLLRRILGRNAERVIEQKRRSAQFRRSLGQVNELLAAKKDAEALALMERLVGGAHGELREALEKEIAPLRRGVARNLAVRRYNEAMAKLHGPDYEAALAGFAEVAATAEDPELVKKARERVAEIREYLSWKKRQRTPAKGR
ncbi:MAG: DUF1570 domain-containing protein [Thermoanaerobaculia bacterium]